MHKNIAEITKIVETFLKECKDINPINKKSFDPITKIAVDHCLSQNSVKLDSEEIEKIFQKIKSISNKVGKLHEDLLVASNNKWRHASRESSWDIECDKYAVEVKNRYNTTKGSDKNKIYDIGKKALEGDFDKFFYAMIWAKGDKVFNKAFTPSDNISKKKRSENENIREIDGRSLYNLVSDNTLTLDSVVELIKKIASR